MSREVICAWLKIPAEPWPPDHYTLLGLQPGESDSARIEHHVHERHESLLRYQLTHPEQVTEAMNRLAQAFVCLSDPEAKKAYDASLLPPPVAPVEVVQTTIAPESNAAPEPMLPVIATPDPLAWLFGPWSQAATDMTSEPDTPARAASSEPDASTKAASLAGAADSENGPSTLAPAPTESTRPEPADPVLALAVHSPSARRGLGTKRALYQRISRTRQLLRAWMQLGKYLGDPARPLGNRDEALELGRQLTVVRQLLQDFPPLLGQAGQAGYVVVVLGRQQMIVQTFVTLLPGQREKLAKDWLDGLELLAAHRRFLRDELWAMRRKGRLGRVLRIGRALLTDQPGLWFFVLALVAINLVYPFSPLLRGVQLVAVCLGLLAYAYYRTSNTHRDWLARTRRRPDSAANAPKAPR
jgi:hypothetical protein